MSPETFVGRFLLDLSSLLSGWSTEDAARNLAFLASVLLLWAAIRKLQAPSVHAAKRMRLSILLLAVLVGLGLAQLGLGRPLLAASLAVVPLAALLFRLAARALDAWGGLSLVLSGQIRVGDTLERDDTLEGVLESVGLARAVIRLPDDTVALVPWAQLQGVVRARRAHAPRHVRLELAFGAPVGQDQLRDFEIRVTLCPYRVLTRPAEVRIDPSRADQVWVELWAWSEAGARKAERHIRQAALLERATLDVTSTPPSGSSPRSPAGG